MKESSQQKVKYPFLKTLLLAAGFTAVGTNAYLRNHCQLPYNKSDFVDPVMALSVQQKTELQKKLAEILPLLSQNCEQEKRFLEPGNQKNMQNVVSEMDSIHAQLYRLLKSFFGDDISVQYTCTHSYQGLPEDIPSRVSDMSLGIKKDDYWAEVNPISGEVHSLRSTFDEYAQQVNKWREQWFWRGLLKLEKNSIK